jgi:hypothetical protein
MGTGAVSPGVRRPGPEGDHLPMCSAEVENEWRYNCTPRHAFHRVFTFVCVMGL